MAHFSAKAYDRDIAGVGRGSGNDFDCTDGTGVEVLATLFTLMISNDGPTVLLVSIAVNIAIGAGAEPAVFALTVALVTSNSFLIPTHQVNALIMGPAGYRVRDFLRAGGIMTLLFLVVMLVTLNRVF